MAWFHRPLFEELWNWKRTPELFKIQGSWQGSSSLYHIVSQWLDVGHLSEILTLSKRIACSQEQVSARDSYESFADHRPRNWGMSTLAQRMGSEGSLKISTRISIQPYSNLFPSHHKLVPSVNRILFGPVSEKLTR